MSPGPGSIWWTKVGKNIQGLRESRKGVYNCDLVVGKIYKSPSLFIKSPGMVSRRYILLFSIQISHCWEAALIFPVVSDPDARSILIVKRVRLAKPGSAFNPVSRNVQKSGGLGIVVASS